MTNAQPEPSMEEILASIRRIISEDEEEAPRQAPRAIAPAEAPRPQPRSAMPAPTPPRDTFAAREPLRAEPLRPEPRADAFLTRERDEPEMRLVTEDVEMIKKNTAHMELDSADEILAEPAAAAASKAFRSLTQTVRVSEGPGKTLEDLVTDMLRPMIKDWLDAHLPAIVEEKVEAEVQRVARRSR